MSEEKSSWSLQKTLIVLAILGVLGVLAFTLQVIPCPPAIHTWLVCPYCKGSDKVTAADWVRGQALRVYNRR